MCGQLRVCLKDPEFFYSLQYNATQRQFEEQNVCIEAGAHHATEMCFSQGHL